MKTPLRLSNRLSDFRFSLVSIGPLRSPVSPLTPKSPPPVLHLQPGLPQVYHASSSHSSSTTPTMTSPESPSEKTPALAIVPVESVGESPVESGLVDGMLQTSTGVQSRDVDQVNSPITPWQATFHRNAASTTQETAYLRQTTRLRVARVVITVLLFALSITLIALQSDILRHFRATSLPTSFSLPLWPTDTNITPTILLLSTSVLTLFLTLPTLVVQIIPSPNPRTTLSNTLFVLLTSLTTLLSCVGLITASVLSPSTLFNSFVSTTLTPLVTTTGPHSTTGLTLNGSGPSPKRETIQSFTCALFNTASRFTRDAKTLNLPYGDVSSMVPAGFGRVCGESQASMGLVLGMCVLAGIGIAVAGWTWRVERGIGRLRGEREVLGSREGVMGGPVFLEKGDLER